MIGLVTDKSSLTNVIEVFGDKINENLYKLPFWFEKVGDHFRLYHENDPPPVIVELEKQRDKVEEALTFLESQGFYIKNLWHIQDVNNKFGDIEDGDAFDILDEAISSDRTIEYINERISDIGNNLLKR